MCPELRRISNRRVYDVPARLTLEVEATPSHIPGMGGAMAGRKDLNPSAAKVTKRKIAPSKLNIEIECKFVHRQSPVLKLSLGLLKRYK